MTKFPGKLLPDSKETENNCDDRCETLFRNLSSVSPKARRIDANSRGEGNSSPAYIVCKIAEKHTNPGQLPRVLLRKLQEYMCSILKTMGSQ